MNTLYVHGLLHSGSAFAFRRQWCKAGGLCEVFSYSAALEPFASLVRRLAARMERFSVYGPYALVGHSFGGVLARAVLGRGLKDAAAPCAVYLVASPLVTPHLAARLGRTRPYRLLTGECGELLTQDRWMRELPVPPLPTIAIAGDIGARALLLPPAASDGRILVEETVAAWLSHHCLVHTHHTLLPFSAEVVSRIRDAWPNP